MMEGENEYAKLVSAKNQKRYEVGVEKNTKEEIVADSEPDKPKTLATLKEQNAGSRTIYTGNLSYSVERADLENLFKECGEIVNVRLHTDYEGRFRGFGHVEFATAEAAQKALQLNNTELLKCPIRVALARGKHRYTPNRSFHAHNFNNMSNSFQMSERIQPVKGSEISGDCEQETEQKASEILQKTPKMLATWKEQNATSKTIHARNLSYSVERADMETLFKECGEIVDIHLLTDRDGRFRGFGYVMFATAEAAQKALELDNTELLRRRIRVNLAQERGEHTWNAWNRSNSFQKHEPMKAPEHSQDCEEKIEEKASKSPHESWDDNKATSKGAEIAVDADQVISKEADEVKLSLKDASATIDLEEPSSGTKRKGQSLTSGTHSQRRKIEEEDQIAALINKVAESLEKFVQAMDKKVDEKDIQEVLHEVELIPDLNKQQWAKAIKWLTENPNQLVVMRVLPIQKKKGYILTFIS